MTLRERIEALWTSLSPTEQRIGEALLRCPPEKLVFATAEDLAQLSGTSDASVIRMSRRLGYSGLPGLKREAGAALTRESAPRDRLERRIAEIGPDLNAALKAVITDARERLDETELSQDPEKLSTAVGLISNATEVVAYGVGGSELAANHLSLKLNRLGHRARHIGTTGFRLADDLLGLRSSDVVVLFVPGRMLPDAEILIERARTVGASCIAVSERPLAERLSGTVDVALIAPQSAGGSTAEALTALIVSDVLLIGVAALDESRALYTSDLLSTLRRRLMGDAEGSRPARDTPPRAQ